MQSSTLPTKDKPRNTKVTPGLAEGKWKYPKDINALDDEVAEYFEEDAFQETPKERANLLRL